MKALATALALAFATAPAFAADVRPAVVGVAYVRLPAPDLLRTAGFYKAAFDAAVQQSAGIVKKP